MNVTGPVVTLQVRDDDKVLEPQRAWARTRPRGCWSGRGSPSFRGTASGRPAPDSSGSTSPPVPRCSPKPWNASREQPVLGDGDWISAMTVLSGRGPGNRHRADPRAARWRPDPSRQGHREIPGAARLRRRRRRPGQLPRHCPEVACRLPGDRKRPAVTEVGQVGGVAQALGHRPRNRRFARFADRRRRHPEPALRIPGRRRIPRPGGQHRAGLVVTGRGSGAADRPLGPQASPARMLPALRGTC